jgi:hypothetical protein
MSDGAQTSWGFDVGEDVGSDSLAVVVGRIDGLSTDKIVSSETCVKVGIIESTMRTIRSVLKYWSF